jgi:hypothetical protein
MRSAVVATREVIYPPSITLPSRQFPGLLCFGAGFFNLNVLAGLSLASFFGATLIVSSSSLGSVADKSELAEYFLGSCP